MRQFTSHLGGKQQKGRQQNRHLVGLGNKDIQSSALLYRASNHYGGVTADSAVSPEPHTVLYISGVCTGTAIDGLI